MYIVFLGIYSAHSLITAVKIQCTYCSRCCTRLGWRVFQLTYMLCKIRMCFSIDLYMDKLQMVKGNLQIFPSGKMSFLKNFERLYSTSSQMLRDSINTIYISFNLLATYTSAYHADGVILYKYQYYCCCCCCCYCYYYMENCFEFELLFLCDFKFASNLGWLIHSIICKKLS